MEINFESFEDLASVIDRFNDDCFWKPILNDAVALQEFNAYLKCIDESQGWPRDRNQEKGKLLEDFALFLFSRFQDVQIQKNHRPGDNESDLEIVLSQKIRPTFMNDQIGPKIICECKNMRSHSIDVGMVTKLGELLSTRGSRFGLFISILGVGGNGWRYGEGKRKKLFLISKMPMISFKVTELAALGKGANFYTLIKEKVNALIDEVDDESPDPPMHEHLEFTKRMIEITSHLERCSIISVLEREDINTRVINKYGKFES